MNKCPMLKNPYKFQITSKTRWVVGWVKTHVLLSAQRTDATSLSVNMNLMKESVCQEAKGRGRTFASILLILSAQQHFSSLSAEECEKGRKHLRGHFDVSPPAAVEEPGQKLSLPPVNKP